MKRIALFIALFFLLTGTAFAATDQILATEEMVGSGHATKSDTLNRVLNKLTTAGDIPHATGAQTVTRLGIGAAGEKLFTNSGATAPEWAAGIKISSFTRDVSVGAGDVAYTGVGFKPSAIIFLSSATQSISVGIDNGTIHGLVAALYGTPPAAYSAAYAFELHVVDGTDNTKALVKTMDTDGFTITYTKAGSPTGTFTIYYLALR